MDGFATVTTALISIITSIIIYNIIKIYLDYRKQSKVVDLLPGPPTVLIFGNSLSFIGDEKVPIKALNQWKEQYGTPYRIWLGANSLVVTDNPEDVQLVFTTYGLLDRGTAITRAIHAITGDGLLAAHPNKWKVYRRLIAPTFTKRILESFMPTFIKKTDILINLLEKHVDKGPIDIWEYLVRQSLDILCSSVMGVETNCQTERNEFIEVIKRIMQITANRFIKLWLHPDILFYITSLGREFIRCRHIMRSFARKVLENRKLILKKNETLSNGKSKDMNDKRPQKKAFLDHFMEIRETNPTFTNQDLLDELQTLIIAGSETTAITNSMVLLLLAMHQDVQKEAYNEIYRVFGDSDRDITLEDLCELRYLEMVIKETLRMFPTVHILQRQVDKEYKLSNCTVPKGCTVTISVKHLHMNPKHWKTPEKFDPLHFLPEEIKNRNSHCYIPFAAGPRICIGLKYAFMTMKVTLCGLLRKYYLTTNVKLEDLEFDSTITMRTSTGYPVELHLRKRALVNQ